MNKIANVLEKLIFYIFIAIYMSVLFIDIVFQYVDYVYRKEQLIWNVFLLPIIMILFVLGCKWYRKNKKKILIRMEKIDKIILIATVVLFFVQVFICLHIYFMTGWDAGIITANADFVAKGETSELWNWYYSKCPNNSLLTAIYALCFWTCEHIGIPSTMVRLIIVVGQCALCCLTGYLMYCCSRKIFNQKICSLLIWLVFVVLQGLSPWLIIPYSDSSCLFLPILLVWLYQNLDKRKYVKCIVIGCISYLGYEMKPMVIIVLLAILGVEFLDNIKEKFSLKKWSVILVICASLVGTMGVCKVVNLEKMMGFELEEGKVFGLTHYFMLGLNYKNSGVYIQSDSDFSYDISSNEERAKENIRVATERIKEFGPVGLAKHSVRKALVNFNDGTFAWGQEGEFNGTIYNIVPETPIKTFLRDFYYDYGKKHNYFKLIVQFVWMIVLAGISCNVLRIRTKEKITKDELVLWISLIGIAMFVMLFEARARYIYTFVPLYIIMAFKGYWTLYQKMFFKE